MSMLLWILLLGASVNGASSSDHRDYYFGFDVVPEVKRNQIETAKKAIKTNEGDKVLNLLKGEAASKSKPSSRTSAQKTKKANESSKSSAKTGAALKKSGGPSIVQSDVPSKRRKKQQKSSHVKTSKVADEQSSKKMKRASSKSATAEEGASGLPQSVNQNDDDLVFDNEELTCYSAPARNLLEIVPDAIVRNPSRCCDHTGSIAAYVTHSAPGTTFWEEAYSSILAQSDVSSSCFIFTGVNEAAAVSSDRDQTILDVVLTVSSLPQVVTLMVVDTTSSSSLASSLRYMHEQQHQQHIVSPLVGVWHAGYDNILLESITKGAGVLPYVGVASSDAAAVFGSTAAQLSLAVLGNDASSLCVATSLTSAPSECSHWYAGRNASIATPIAVCDAEWSLPVVEGAVDVIWATRGCCQRVVDAIEEGSPTLVGCHTDEAGANSAHFSLRQPVAFQASTVAAWANAAVVASQRGGSGRYAFPALGTVVATGLEPVLSL